MSESDINWKTAKQIVLESDKWDSWEDFVSESTKEDVESEDDEIDERLDFERIEKEFSDKEGDNDGQ